MGSKIPVLLMLAIVAVAMLILFASFSSVPGFTGFHLLSVSVVLILLGIVISSIFGRGDRR